MTSSTLFCLNLIKLHMHDLCVNLFDLELLRGKGGGGNCKYVLRFLVKFRCCPNNFAASRVHSYMVFFFIKANLHGGLYSTLCAAFVYFNTQPHHVFTAGLPDPGQREAAPTSFYIPTQPHHVFAAGLPDPGQREADAGAGTEPARRSVWGGASLQHRVWGRHLQPAHDMPRTLPDCDTLDHMAVGPTERHFLTFVFKIMTTSMFVS